MKLQKKWRHLSSVAIDQQYRITRVSVVAEGGLQCPHLVADRLVPLRN